MLIHIITFILLFTFPLVLLLFARKLKRNPGTPHGTIGYRTRRSKKSQAAWVFAQEYASERIHRAGILLAAITAMIYILDVLERQVESANNMMLMICLWLIQFVYIIFKTEYVLKENFENDGKPRTDRN